MRYLLTINMYQLLIRNNMYVNVFFVLQDVLNMTSITVCIGVSNPP